MSGLLSFFVPGALALGGRLTGQRFADVSPLAAAAAGCRITDSEGHIGSFVAAPAFAARVVSFLAQHLGGTGVA